MGIPPPLTDDERVLRRLRDCTAAQVAAVLTLVSLSGAARLAAAAEGPRAGGHRCTCLARDAERRCECPLCWAAAAERHARDGDVPPCHRGRGEAAAPAKETPLAAGLPCLKGRCGSPEAPGTTVTGLEPFTLPQHASPAGTVPLGAMGAVALAPESVPSAPETPPPRA